MEFCARSGRKDPDDGKEVAMYVGVGTLVAIILLIILVIWIF